MGEKYAMAQATRGSAPDIAGKNIANEPKAVKAAQLIDAAVGKVIAEAKHLTADLGGKASTTEMGDAIASAV